MYIKKKLKFLFVIRQTGAFGITGDIPMMHSFATSLPPKMMEINSKRSLHATKKGV
jgi:hypothetical protein